jgi:integrase
MAARSRGSTSGARYGGPRSNSPSSPYRPPCNLRHTFAYWSLRAGVPIATVAREMGHTSTEQTFRVYGGWCREMGADAAAMRTAWAERDDKDVNAAAE